jgi:hypothetical protein
LQFGVLHRRQVARQTLHRGQGEFLLLVSAAILSAG